MTYFLKCFLLSLGDLLPLSACAASFSTSLTTAVEEEEVVVVVVVPWCCCWSTDRCCLLGERVRDREWSAKGERNREREGERRRAFLSPSHGRQP